MQPGQQFSPDQQSNTPLNYVAPTPEGPQQPSIKPFDGGKSPKKSRRNLVLLGIGGAVLLLIVITVVVLAFNKQAPVQKQQTDEQASGAQGPQPANAIEVEQTNNSISQDLSSVNDDVDFPADALSDKSLQL